VRVIPYGRQDVNQRDIDAVVDVLRSDWITQGPTVPLFENAVASYCGANHAVAANSATSALHLACKALGLGPGDWLWTTPNTFVASANCGRYCGAEVDFVDIDALSLNIDPTVLARKLEHANRLGRLPKILVPVHFSGLSCDMRAIHLLSQQYGFRIIEDASHAIGGQYLGKPVGNGEYSDITIFSFHPVKIVTTGEGGMAVTNDPLLAERMRNLRSHGIPRSDEGLTNVGAWYYEQKELGFNYRLTDLQAALGLSQMQRIDQLVERRRVLASRYAKLLEGLPLRPPAASEESAWHLYVIQLEEADRRRAVFDDLRSEGIGVNVHYIPVYTQPDYQRLGFRPGYCPAAETYYSRAITLPLFPAMTDSNQHRVVEVLRQAVS